MTGPEEATLDLAASPGSVPSARRLARQLAVQADLPSDVADVVQLVVSELVTNAVVHAGTRIRVHLVVDGRRVRIEVCDEAPLPPTLRVHSATATTGRGLRLLHAVTDAWGVEDVEDGGKMVWAEVSLAAQPRDADLAARYGDVSAMLAGSSDGAGGLS